jgi:hypothetical protein
MKLLVAAMLALFALPNLTAAEPEKGQSTTRYGIELDLKSYPQGTPRETLASVLKAIANKRFDYVVAQLADPAYFDERIKRLFAGKFDEQVAETRTKLDAPTVKLLERFLSDGDWEATKSPVLVLLKDVKDKSLMFVKIGDHWYWKNNYQPE